MCRRVVARAADQQVAAQREAAAVDSGEAATLEEAQRVLSSKGHAASLQKEAATLEEASQVLGSQGRAAALQNMVDRGEAATLEAAPLAVSRARRADCLRVKRGESRLFREAPRREPNLGARLVSSGYRRTTNYESRLFQVPVGFPHSGMWESGARGA